MIISTLNWMCRYSIGCKYYNSKDSKVSEKFAAQVFHDQMCYSPIYSFTSKQIKELV